MMVAKADYAWAVRVRPRLGVDASVEDADTCRAPNLHPCGGAGGMMYTGRVPSGRQCFPRRSTLGCPPIRF